MLRDKKFCTFFVALAVLVLFPLLAESKKSSVDKKSRAKKEMADKTYQEYLDYFEEVYKTMEENYYKLVERKDYERFLEVFNSKIYPELISTGKSIDYVRWRSASKMIEFLKDKEDVFSELYPPKPAKEYEQTALGKRVDLGIKGKVIPQGYEVTFIEPRSDAFEKGLRENDLIIALGDKNIKDLPEEEINKLLEPLEGSITAIKYFRAIDKSPSEIKVESKEYFKQSVFEIPIPAKGYFGLQIERFNRKTGEDVFRFMEFFKKRGPMNGLVIDLRNNPGGPPLAARELSSFFLPGGDDFAYFKNKGEPKGMLDVPTIPNEYKYDGPIVILINNKSGSAAELFSGIMQRRKKAVLMGQNSAGQVMLKSMFNFKDESMLLLITARGSHPDGMVFPFSGLVPDRFVSEQEEDMLLKDAVGYLYYMNQKEANGQK